ncbi:hypothetical protein CORC01_07305 [Colletotrichum orchidophilum]|uniref:Methyltransferase domain-containing protein n=1 Tax=Colletotrichum orchidophilum TaxID=1209926 RepID=A0A1G4B7H2_9PEZI|nr:uncharacterized protein CORC01_07305 [Colletotrichum orchidophilum]OHE97400.1 hypothetical protein CORC01_07305 [Colletotrichum orchidophilum]
MCPDDSAVDQAPAASSPVAPLPAAAAAQLNEETEQGVFIAADEVPLLSILDYRIENGRTYHRYKDGSQFKDLADDLQHNLFIRTFHDHLGNAPPADFDAKVGRVLDIGTGSGIWAIDYGEEHPEAEVLGVDLSAVQPEFVPPNVRFEVDDIEEPWIFSDAFDYIHCRMMTWSITDWKKLFKQSYDNLNPGGYLEANEVDLIPLSDDGTLKEDSNLMKSVRLWGSAAEIFGRPFADTRRLKQFMEEVGFEDVQMKRFKWPTNSWPKDRHYKELGEWNLENISPAWEGFLMAPLTRAHGWTREEAIVHIMEARRDIADRSIHAYFSIWSIYGRKPAKAENAES